MVKFRPNFFPFPSIKLPGGIFFIPITIGGTYLIYTVTPDNNRFKDSFKYTISGLNRSLQCISTTAIIASDYYLHSSSSSSTISDTTEEENTFEKIKEQHKRNAKRLLSLFRRLGGVFIKLGQHLSSLEYIIPIEYCTAMSELHSSAPQSSMEDIWKTLKEELKDSDFHSIKTISPSPLGSASLAQVHYTIMVDGSELALKVQHRSVSRFMALDMTMVRMASTVIHHIFPLFNLQWLVDEMSRNLPEEVCFLKEAQNAQRSIVDFQKSPQIIIPKPIFATKRVLGMQYIKDGIKIDDKETMEKNGISPAKVYELVLDVWANMIFRTGNMHCDPHPGNILVVPKQKGSFSLAILDHGLYREISKALQKSFGGLWTSILLGTKRDVDSSVRELLMSANEEMTDDRRSADIEEKARMLTTILTQRHKAIGTDLFKFRKPLESETSRLKLPPMTISLFGSLSHLLDQIPRPLIMILKTNDLLMHLERRLLCTPTPNRIFFIYASYSIWQSGTGGHFGGRRAEGCISTIKAMKRIAKLHFLSLLASIQQHLLQKVPLYSLFIDHFVQTFNGRMADAQH